MIPEAFEIKEESTYTVCGETFTDKLEAEFYALLMKRRVQLKERGFRSPDIAVFMEKPLVFARLAKVFDQLGGAEGFFVDTTGKVARVEAVQ